MNIHLEFDALRDGVNESRFAHTGCSRQVQSAGTTTIPRVLIAHLYEVNIQVYKLLKSINYKFISL